MICNIKEAVVKQFSYFPKWNIDGFRVSRKLFIISKKLSWSRLHTFPMKYRWFGIPKRLLWSHVFTFLMKYLWLWNLQEVVEKPLSMLWNIKKAVVKQFAYFSYEILMGLESTGSCLKYTGSCREADYIPFQWNIDGLEFPRGCCEAIFFFLIKYWLFTNLQEVVGKQLLMIWNIKEADVKHLEAFRMKY